MNTTDDHRAKRPSIIDPLLYDDSAAQKRLHDGLVAAAEAEGILDVAYRLVDTPVGSLLLAATDQGLVRVAYANEDHDSVLSALARDISPRVMNAPARLDAAARQIDEYFAGRLMVFDVPLDLRLSRGFRREVLAHLLEIGYGKTATYSWVAAAAGNAKAVRAAGSACATNPIPVVIPCHRVVRSDGTIGRYGGGGAIKKALLALEASA
jgi:methylated-DNA-[protein]-cysteine S-methyltransferase